MHVATYTALLDEVQKVKEAGVLSPALSMGGLAGLTAIEGAGAFGKNKTKKERLKSGAEAGFTGSILASEAIHNKDMLKGGLKKGVAAAKKFIPAVGKVVHASVADGALSLFRKEADADLWNPSTGALSQMSSRANRMQGAVGHAASSMPKARISGSDMMKHIMDAKKGLAKGIGTTIRAVR